MKIGTTFGLILGLIVLVLGQKTTSIDSTKAYEKSQICTSVAEGVQLCVISPHLFVRFREQINIKLALTNLAEENASVSQLNKSEPPYKLMLIDENGTEILSKIETLKKKKENLNITQAESDELFELCCINIGSHGDVFLKSRETLTFDLNFNHYYEPLLPGKYHLEIARKIANRTKTEENTLLLKGIVIEVEN